MTELPEELKQKIGLAIYAAGFEGEPPDDATFIGALADAAISILEREGFEITEGWRTIEGAPKDTDVIVTNGAATGEARFYEGAGWFWAGGHPTDYQDSKVHQPTLWRPLPKPPEGK